MEPRRDRHLRKRLARQDTRAREAPVQGEPAASSEVGIWRRLNEDLYLNFASYEDGTAVFQAFVFPLVSWIWIGFWALMMGTLICLVPNKARPAPAAQPRVKAGRPEVKEVELTR